MEGRLGYTMYEEALTALMLFGNRKWKKMSNYVLYLRKKVLVEGGDDVEEILSEQGHRRTMKRKMLQNPNSLDIWRSVSCTI
jgi:hypothetical protein